MAVTKRAPESHQGPLTAYAATSARYQQSPETIRSRVGSPSSWYTTPSSSAASSPRLSFSNESASDPRSPIPGISFSPIKLPKEPTHPTPMSLCIEKAPRMLEPKPSKRFLISDPNSQNVISYHEAERRSRVDSLLLEQEPSLEPTEGGIYQGSPVTVYKYAQDPITEQLNCLLLEQNKRPLPPIDPAHNSGARRQVLVPSEASQHAHGKPRQSTALPKQLKKPRAKNILGRKHNNVKYLKEELDFTRFHRVDLGEQWAEVGRQYRRFFSFREKGGLEGAYYRQNLELPLIVNDELVFMENGHVQTVEVPTRGQLERKQCYGLIYLYPDRAWTYSWLPPTARMIAYKLYRIRQRQLEDGRDAAMRRGTYVEKSEVPCGCCPPEDRERDPQKRHEKKLAQIAQRKFSQRMNIRGRKRAYNMHKPIKAML